MTLRSAIENDTGIADEDRKLIHYFFRDVAQCYLFHFQPSFLKGQVAGDRSQTKDHELRIASHLGYEGNNLQHILRLVHEREPETYNRFLALLRRFEPSFQSLTIDKKKEKLFWQFDLGRDPARLEHFDPDMLSDGLMRAAAIALLAAMQTPPALMMIEEIEDGISQKNLGSFIGWLMGAAGPPDTSDRGHRTQFIFTSHSPSVLREFSNELDHVYYTRLHRDGFRSIVTNLNSALKSFIELGTVEGEIEERDGKSIVNISPGRLLDLWYSGIIGGEAA
jgi:predicted ATPase